MNGSRTRVDLGRPIALVSPAAAYLVCASLVVSTAAWLGAHWLRDATVGLPAGVWIILLGTGLTAYLNRDRPAESKGRAAVPPRIAWRPWVRRALELPGLIARRLGAGVDGLTRAQSRCTQLLDRFRLPAGALRVGVGLDGDLRSALVESEGELEITWVRLPRRGDDQSDCARFGLDAVVRRGEFGPMRITAAVSAGRDAAWYDWSRPRPLSYAAVFPGRVDPELVTVFDADELHAGDAPSLRVLVEAAAALSRSPSRLSITDRLLGRSPLPRGTDSAPAETVVPGLADRLTAGVPTPAAVLRPIARAVGAWLASTPAPVDLPTRRRGVEAAALALGEEPETLLRLAAVRVATGDDGGAFDAIIRADRAIRSGRLAPVVDPFRFLEAELRLTAPDSLQLGRVAAGIAQVCAGAPSDHLGHLRDDIAEDLGFTEWLIGRDQDRALLLEVFRVIARARGDGALRSAA